MCWKTELYKFEKNGQWRDAVELLQAVIDHEPDNKEAYIRIIYLLHNILVDQDWSDTGLTHDHLETLLSKYFHDSYCRYSTDPEYLFFIGTIMHIAEWYFGQNDESLALEFQKRAMEMEPDNALFRFGYLFSAGSDSAVLNELANEIVSNRKYTVWAQSKGYPGTYVMGLVRTQIGLPWDPS
jgi:tetratricopeptide (TPR) repeat protein